jgi:CheY-like chemotaxis protein
LHLANPFHDASRDPACASLAPAFDSRVSTILLVEDDAFVRSVAYEILCSAGYRVLAARNGADAVRTFRGDGKNMQLLLTDVVLPDRDGFDLALELVTAESGLKAIFISGYPENSITRKGLQHPGWFYLPKQFSAVSLLRKVKEALNELPMR